MGRPHRPRRFFVELAVLWSVQTFGQRLGLSRILAASLDNRASNSLASTLNKCRRWGLAASA